MFKTLLKQFVQFKFNPVKKNSAENKLDSYVYNEIEPQLNDNYKTFHNKIILNTEFKHRHIIIHGPKGAGKTTLLKLLYYKYMSDNKENSFSGPENIIYIKFNFSNIDNIFKILPKNQLSNFIHYFFVVLLKLKTQYGIDIFIVISDIKKMLRFLDYFSKTEKELIYFLYYIIFKFYSLQLFTFIFIVHKNSVKKKIEILFSKLNKGLFIKSSENSIYTYINSIENDYIRLQKFSIYFKFLYCKRKQDILTDNICFMNTISFKPNYLQDKHSLKLILYKYIHSSCYIKNAQLLDLFHKNSDFVSWIVSLSFKFRILNLVNPLNCLVLFKVLIDNIANNSKNSIPLNLINIFVKHNYSYIHNYVTTPVDVLLKNQLIEIFKSNISVIKNSAKKNTNLQTKFGALKTHIKTYLSGQDHVIDSVFDSIRKYSMGFKNNKPIGAHLFAGFSGTGKTELTKYIAAALESNDDFRFLKLEMSEYQAISDVNKLIGSAPGFVGHGDPGKLSIVKTHPRCVILLDEVEKAEPRIYDIFLSIFDEGIFKDTSNNILDFTDTLFILTSNLGCEFKTFENYPKLAQSKTFDRDEYNIYRKSIYAKANKFFRPEFLTRLSSIDIFNPILGSDTPIIYKNFYNDFITSLVNDYLNTSNIFVSIDPLIKNKLTGVLERYLDPCTGVRPLKKIFNILLENPILEILELVQLKKIAMNNPKYTYILQLKLDPYSNITFKLGKSDLHL